MPEAAQVQVYLAAPVFTQMERQWNRAFAAALRTHAPGVEMVLPQDFRVEGRFNAPEHFAMLFDRCRESIRHSTAVVAVLEGADADSGVAFEVGFAHALGVPVVGLRTDYREGQDRGLNLMLSHACRYCVREFSFREDVDQLAAATARRLRKLLDGGQSGESWV